MKADDHDFRLDVDPKAPAPLGKDIRVLIVLIVLAALMAVLWFADPSHQPNGESRAEWPVAQPAKP
jgi:predicted secreted protein